MNDYISKQDAVKAIHEAIYDFFDVDDSDDESPMTYFDKKLLEVNKAISKRIASVPTADVVEVVRCNDCKFRGHIQRCPFGKRTMPHANGYCCYGERREDG